MNRTYTVEIYPDPQDGRYWLADVVGLSNARASARSIETLERYVREVITLVEDLPDSSLADIKLDLQI